MRVKTDNENVWVDLVKIFCAFVVAAGHCLFSSSVLLSWLPDAVACAVQILFLFSGYYAAKTGVLKERDKISGYLAHLLRMLLVWMGIYFVYGAYHTDKTASVWLYMYAKAEIEKAAGLDSGHLWYIEVLVVVAALLYCLKKTKITTKEMLASVVFSAVFWNTLSRGIAGLAVGIWLAGRTEEEKKQEGRKNTWQVLSVGAPAFALIIACHYTDFGMPFWLLQIMKYLMLHVAAAAVCRTAVQAGRTVVRAENGRGIGCGGKTAYYIRKISTFVYLSHMLFLQQGIGFASNYTAWDSGHGWLLCSVYVAAVSTALGIAVIWLSGRRGFGWVRRLY